MRDSSPPPQLPSEKLPSCPPKVYEIRSGRELVDKTDTEVASDLESNKDSTMPRAVKSPWWSRYTGYQRLRVLPPSRTRKLLLLTAVVGTSILIGVLIGLWRSGRLGAFPKSTVKITLTQGTYSGEITSKSSTYPRAVEAWRGIPYAQSTAGNNRFRPPQALSSTPSPDMVYSATDFGQVCPQGGGGGEDCLNLNIYRPHFGDNQTADALDMAKLGGASTKLPVVIYVHGGGFGGGSGKERNMASFVSWAETPMIGISFNYRVGALGFLPSALTKEEGALNLGLKDQQMLFAWVQKNVASFGGDPENVTLMGLSAGSHSIGHQIISYASANKLTSDPAPFHKAILESGASTARAVFAPAHPMYETQFQEFVSACGLTGVADEDLFEQLRQLPLSKVQGASNSVWQKYYRSLRWAFQPSIDGPGGIIPDLPLLSWQKGNFLRIPIMTGFSTNEGTIFVPSAASESTALRSVMGALLPSLNQTDVAKMENMYPDPLNSTLGKDMYLDNQPTGFGKQFWRLDDAYSHYAYICPVLQTAHYASTSTSDAPVYVYHFAARSWPHSATDHGDESPVVVHDMAVVSDYPGLVKAADAMTGYWSRFAAFGDPNPTSGETITDSTYGTTWQRFKSPFANSTTESAEVNASQGQLTLFAKGNDERMKTKGTNSPGVPTQTITVTDRELEECQFWFDRVIYSEGFGNGSLTFA